MTYNRVSFKTRSKLKMIANRKKAIPRQQLIKVGNTNIKHGISQSEITWLNLLNVPERSKLIRGFHGKIYIVDGYDAKTNTVFEYLGNSWHGSHRTYPRNRDAIIPFLKKTPNQLYNETVERFNYLHSIGCRVFFVWEDDDKKHRSNGRFYRGPGDNLY